MTPRRKRPTIADVAKRAGVSEGTVSVVLNNRVGEHVRVSEGTQRKVHDAVRELGYVANPMAQGLAGGQNRIIAIFTFEAIFPIDSRNFYYPFLIGIEEEAEAQGYDILLITGSNRDRGGRRRIYQDGINRLRRADGAILMGARSSKDEVHQLIEEDYPFVFVGRRDSPGDNISYAAADYVEATVEVVEYLFSFHHQHVAYISTGLDKESSHDRCEGIHTAFRRAGFSFPESRIWEGTPDALAMADLEAFRDGGVTAFIAEDDALAHRILQLTDGSRWRCPQDFSLATLGDPLKMAETTPSWTTFRIPRHDMGREAVRLLVRQLNEGDPGIHRTVLPCTFIPGSTVAVPPGNAGRL